MSFLKKIELLIRNVAEKGFFNLLSANVLVQLVAFASQLFVAGILSPDDLGRIKILQTWLSVFSIVGGMGFNNSTLKLCSENRTRKEIQTIFQSGLLFTLISTVTAYLLVLIINSLGLISKELLIRSLIPLAMLPMIANGLFTFYVGYFQSQKEFKFISNITSINKLLAVFLIVGFTYLMGVRGYYIGYNLAAFSLVIAVFLIGKSKIKGGENKIDFHSQYKLHKKYSFPSFLSVLLIDLASYADILIINFLLFTQMLDIGFYSFALTLTVALRVLPSTVQQITEPYFSGLAENPDEFKQIYRRYSNMLIVIIFLTLIGALIVFIPFMNYVFEGKYAASIPYFIPLAIGWSIRQYNQIQSAALFGKGAINKIAESQLYALIFNVIVIIISIKFWGIIGVAYVSILCALFEVAIYFYHVKRHVK